MNRICISVLLLFFIITMSCNSYNKDKSLAIESRYFGEESLGLSLSPKIVDPKIVSPEGSFEGGITLLSRVR